jgi:hypothetical protein
MVFAEEGEMSLFEKLYLFTQLGLIALAAWALIYYRAQASFNRLQANFAKQDHLSGVYRIVFELMDEKKVRDARHIVYEMHPITAKDVAPEQLRDAQYWKGSPTRAEIDAADTVARAFDRLGLLVREGVVPLNIVAHFYVSPAIRCWYKLQPFVGVERDKRMQNGHLWEWENLVLRILIPKIQEGEGVWKGVSKHDGLESYCDKIQRQAYEAPIPSDKDYAPASKLWIV